MSAQLSTPRDQCEDSATSDPSLASVASVKSGEKSNLQNQSTADDHLTTDIVGEFEEEQQQQQQEQHQSQDLPHQEQQHAQKRKGRKPSATEAATKRQMQKRAAARAFRERKETYVRGLEDQLRRFEERDAGLRLGLCAKLAVLQQESDTLKLRLLLPSPSASSSSAAASVATPLPPPPAVSDILPPSSFLPGSSQIAHSSSPPIFSDLWASLLSPPQEQGTSLDLFALSDSGDSIRTLQSSDNSHFLGDSESLDYFILFGQK